MLKKLTLGTANFNNCYGLSKNNLKFSNISIKKIFNFSNINGIQNIDTAAKYLGVEKKLGSFKLSKFKVSSKLTAVPVNCKNVKKFIFKKLYNSIKYLNVNKLENYFIHCPEDLIKSRFKNEIYESLLLAKKKKLIKRIGISIYSIKELNLITKKYKIDIVQLPFSLFDRRFLHTFFRLKKKKILVQVRSIFLQGLLLSQFDDLPKYFSKFQEFRNFEDWLSKNKISKLEACINFLKSHNYIDNYIIGFNNLEQLKEIIKVFKNKKKKIFPKIFSRNTNLTDPRKWKKNLTL